MILVQKSPQSCARSLPSVKDPSHVSWHPPMLFNTRPPVETFLVLVLFAGFGCSKPQPPPEDSRSLKPAVDGSERHEIRCIGRPACEKRARRACPSGYEVEDEWHAGDEPRGQAAEHPPTRASEIEDSRRVEFGTQSSMGLVIRCYDEPANQQ